jgi:hypothetical protein
MFFIYEKTNDVKADSITLNSNYAFGESKDYVKNFLQLA